jgi:hypothetical protein
LQFGRFATAPDDFRRQSSLGESIDLKLFQ